MQDKIKELLKEAMKAGDETAKMTYRGLLSSFMNELVSKMKKPQDLLSDEEVMTVIRREIKKREDAIKQFIEAGRKELADSEILELDVLKKFLPAQLSFPEVEAKAKEILEKVGEIDMKKTGQYIGMVVKELKDVAHSEDIRKAVDKFLGK